MKIEMKDLLIHKTIGAIIKKPQSKLISLYKGTKLDKSNEYIRTLLQFKPKEIRNIRSMFRGDSIIRVESDEYMSRFFISSMNNKGKWVVNTVRNYKKINPKMHLPTHLNADDLYKSVDTNMIVHSENNYLGAFLKKWFKTNNVQELYGKEMTVRKIHARDMINVMKIFEISIFHNDENEWSNTKCVGKIITNGIHSELINFEKIEFLLKGVNCRLYTQRQYLYIEFFDAKGKVLYVISQRSEKHKYKPNCAFINRCLLDFYK